MLQTRNIEELTRTGFLAPALSSYNGEINTTKAGSGTSMADKPNDQPINGNRELDQVLVERAQAGDKKAFGLLVEKYHRKLGRLLSRMVRDQAEVEDIVQESFIKAYRALHNFRGDSAFYTWLYRIGINTAKNYWFQWVAGRKYCRKLKLKMLKTLKMAARCAPWKHRKLP